MKNLLFAIAAILFIAACATEDQKGWKEMSLLEYGVPITIAAPDSVNVKTMDFGLQRDITIQDGDNYSLQIYASDAITSDVKQVKDQQLAIVKENRYFKNVIEESDNGFIYQNQIDSTKSNYGFRYVVLKGDKEYIFRTGLIGSYTEEQVRKMYNSVQEGGK